MKQYQLPGESKFTERFGQLLWREGSDQGKIWLLFPSFKNTMVGVFLENQMGAYLRQRWYRGVIDPEQLREEAEDALTRDGWEEFPIVLVDVHSQRVLFVRTEGDTGVEWNLIGAFEYGNPPKDQSQPVRWIRLSQPLPETFLALHGFTPSSSPDDIQTQCDKVLKEARDWTGDIRAVTCFLTIDLEKRIYRVDLFEGSTSIAQKETSSTDDVISFLRYPLRKGEYFSAADGTQLKWDPLKDTEYDEVITEDKDGKLSSFNLSIFKPLVHRSSFFPNSFVLPSTSEEFLQTKAGEDIILRIIVNEQLRSFGNKKYLNVQFVGLKKSALNSLENESMGIFDIALLTECEQLLDVESGKRFRISINAESLVPLRIVHLLSEYPKLQSIIMSLIDDLQLSATEGYEKGLEENRAYLEPDYEEGLEEEPDYIEPDYDGE